MRDVKKVFLWVKHYLFRDKDYDIKLTDTAILIPLLVILSEALNQMVQGKAEESH